MSEDGGNLTEKPAPTRAPQGQPGPHQGGAGEVSVPGSALYQPPVAGNDAAPDPWERVQGRRIEAEQPHARWSRMQAERADVGASIQRRIVAQRKASGPAGAAQIPTGSGSPLGREVKRSIGPHLGADLDGVRVHTGGDSAEAAAKMGARAFTVGSDVHFGAGEYTPGTKEGDRLLAHELTHTVQAQKSGVQRKAEPGDDGKGDGEHEVSQEGEPAEQEADAVGNHVADAIHDGKDSDNKKDDGAAEPGAGKEKAPSIAAKLLHGVSRKPKPQPIAARLTGVGRKIFRAKTNRADAGFVLVVDATGKVHGDLPPMAPKEWKKEQLEVSRDQLTKSIQTRKAEQKRLGEHGPHRARIAEEEALLRSIVKRLGGS